MSIEIKVTCMVKKCGGDGIFFMRHLRRDGKFQSGLVCDAHERQFAAENLRRTGGKDILE